MQTMTFSGCSSIDSVRGKLAGLDGSPVTLTRNHEDFAGFSYGRLERGPDGSYSIRCFHMTHPDVDSEIAGMYHNALDGGRIPGPQFSSMVLEY
jgi:hypothetical protein